MEENDLNDEIIGTEIPETNVEDSKIVIKDNGSDLAFTTFNSSIKRADNLLNINIDLKNKKIAISEDKLLDSYRAVIVLSISALDAYVKTFLIVTIKQKLNNRTLSPELKKYIKEELFTKDTLHQFVLENNFHQKVIEKFDEDFEKKSFQGQKTIDKYMGLAGFSQIFKSISKNADKSIDNLLRDIEIYTQRRHLIVHCGDHDLNQTSLTENSICLTDASECIKLVSLIATEIHKLSKDK